MRRLVDLLLLAASVPCVVSAAGAQETETGSRLEKHQSMGVAQSPRAAAVAAQRYVECLYAKRGPAVRAALAEDDPATAAGQLNKLDYGGTCINLSLSNDDALEQQMDIPTFIFRGLLAEAVLKNTRSPLPAPLPRQARYSRRWFTATTRPLAVDEMAACVADTNPSGIQALLSTGPGSSGEQEAVSALVPSLGPCLTVGAKLTANAQSLRAALAEALYHREFDSPEPAPGSTGAAPAVIPQQHAGPTHGGG